MVKEGPMNILYIAKHHSGGGDDEGAIADALKRLGHFVIHCYERDGASACKVECDFVLFHHWHDYGALNKFKVPKVMWCFDLIDYPDDPTLGVRCLQRKVWAEELIPRINLAFMTDGDYVEKHPNAVWLPQGADQRIVGTGEDNGTVSAPILFTGIKNGGGVGRRKFVDDMEVRYGHRFVHFPSGLYGVQLRDAIAASAVVVAPDSPVTGKYWSNRIYVALGFGACLLHPTCLRLLSQYRHGLDCVFYREREDLYYWVDRLLEDDAFRYNLSENGLETTTHNHTYVHRCAQLVDMVREVLL